MNTNLWSLFKSILNKETLILLLKTTMSKFYPQFPLIKKEFGVKTFIEVMDFAFTCFNKVNFERRMQ